eukprot:CAMPEP_0194217264 /NCGR_PEP_ID=MMETSP0156-20130528/20830_1 /TAXON_ID=33649 /ORGANISM="Thalassionema nitzschioides, Strain L26-B" /LENGTH=43 /DNA_ID= /DNA_START= /DNA_END= /DNA_ORIENTATION=
MVTVNVFLIVFSVWSACVLSQPPKNAIIEEEVSREKEEEVEKA